MGTVPNLTDETPLDQYTATASQTEFTFTFMIFATSDIKVYVNDVLKTETTDYVVKQADLSAIVPADDLPMDGGKIVFNSGLTVSDAVSISREIPIDRLTGYSVAGAFRANVLNTELTRMQAIMQQLERDISRSIRLTPSDAEGGTLDMPGSRAGNFLAFDLSGNLIVSAGTIGTTPITVSSFMETVLDDTTAAAARTTLGVAIGSDVQAYDADLTDIAALTVARGDILVGNSSADWTNLAKGAANYILKSDGTDPSWGFEVLDEDNMASDSDVKLATQQSIKAYTDANAGAMKLLATVTASASATVDFDNFLDSTYEVYMLTYSSVLAASDAVDLYTRFGTGATPTYQATNYRYSKTGGRDGSVVQRDTSTGTTTAIIMNDTGVNSLGNVSGEEVSGAMFIHGAASAVDTYCHFHHSREDATGRIQNETGVGKWVDTTAVTSIRMLMSSGNIASGEFKLYGIKKS